jgi:predicted phosphodiesterase
MLLTKIVTFADLHNPYQINLKPVLSYISDEGFDVIQYLGDTSNAESCNHWKEAKHYHKDVECVADDYENLRTQILEPFRKAMPKKHKSVFHIGNHEDWFYQTMLADDKCKGKYGIEDNIDLKLYNMEIVPLNRHKQFGKLYFTHGVYIKEHHAKSMALHYRRNIRYGHTHDMQQYMIQSPIDRDEKVVAQSVGCMCNLDMVYLKNRPHKWVNAFNVAYIRPDGSFNDYTIVITDGKFTAPNGRTYK